MKYLQIEEEVAENSIELEVKEPIPEKKTNSKATMYERMSEAQRIKLSMYLPPKLKSQVKVAVNARIDKEFSNREAVE